MLSYSTWLVFLVFIQCNQLYFDVFLNIDETLVMSHELTIYFLNLKFVKKAQSYTFIALVYFTKIVFSNVCI